ncbi:cholecystokinin receptor type A-like [Patiria miniata]|uniref:G-protein coupled receptors family 1 profile domain-containing protein n=1 Tax=Patiria miniata TaxID=46514 RepID=A0A913Z6S9_PATMI|nr:cholecystokinin receptor type A-like [Patiria miniata]
MEDILVLRIYKTFIGIFGILGNGLVCVVIGKVSAMQTRTNAFIFHQAVVDFLGSTIILLTSEVPLPDPLPDDSLGRFLCLVWLSNFLLFILFVISTFNLLSLTLERYFAIVYPFKYQAAFAEHPHLKIGAVIGACWIIGVVIKVYNLIIFKVEDGRCLSNAAARSQAVGILTVVLVYFLPVGVMFFAYMRISLELKRGASRVGPQPAVAAPAGASGPSTSGGAGASSSAETGMMGSLLRARRNTFKTLLIVFITFMVCWTPNQLIFFMFNLGWKTQPNEWYYLLSVAMVATNCCVNPVIYAFKYRQFRNGLKEMFCGQKFRADDMA